DVGLLERASEALQLEVEAFREEPQPALEGALGVALLAVDERAADVAVGGPGERDQPGEVLGRQPAPLDARHAALLSLEVSAAHEPREIAVARRGLAEERQARGRRALALLAHQQI